jgi:hypothetical protein
VAAQRLLVIKPNNHIYVRHVEVMRWIHLHAEAIMKKLDRRPRRAKARS